MSNIDKQTLRDSAESTIGILENIAGFEPSDIDGDTVELRFETEDGFDTGCDVSIVDQCQKAADLVRALLDELEAKDKRIAELDARTLVPVEPTLDQLVAGKRRLTSTGRMSRLMSQRLAEVYRAMVSAAAAGKGE